MLLDHKGHTSQTHLRDLQANLLINPRIFTHTVALVQAQYQPHQQASPQPARSRLPKDTILVDPTLRPGIPTLEMTLHRLLGNPPAAETIRFLQLKMTPGYHLQTFQAIQILPAPFIPTPTLRPKTKREVDLEEIR